MVHRVIARLDIKGPNLVKGIHLEGLRVLGSPKDFATHYYQSGADELIYQDVVASLYGRNSLKEFITNTAKDIFIPLTVGGGLRTLGDINDVLRAGADKVCLNTATIQRPQLIKEAAERFGSSTIVIAIEASKQASGKYLAYTDNGREFTGIDVHKWAQEVESLGAGEILLTSIDREGTGEGYDINLVKSVAQLVKIPVIAHGGCNSPQNAAHAIKDGKASAVAIASIFHYSTIQNKMNLSKNQKEGNTEFLQSGKTFSRIQPYAVSDVKSHLIEKGIKCRPY